MTRLADLLDRSRLAVGRLLGSSAQARQATAANGTANGTGPSGRDWMPELCSTVAQRDLSLVDSAYALLEEMEAAEDDPGRLDQLYRLDHLITRLRRNNENLLVLSGHANTAPEVVPATTSIVDVVRAAMSAIERYRRITIDDTITGIAPFGVIGSAADDVSAVLAELLDNATGHTDAHPDAGATVTVSARRGDQDLLITVEDHGAGLPADRLALLNARLADEPVLDEHASRHSGLAVVARIAHRHGIEVRLGHRAPHGIIATVRLPAALIGELDEPEPEPPRDGGVTASGLPRRVPGRSAVLPSESGERGNDKKPDRRPEEETDEEGAAKLLADLAAFAEGEEAAIADGPPAMESDEPS